MISLRKVVAATATGALALAGLVAGTANAQSSQVPVSVSVKVSAGAPANITGYAVVVNCTAPTSTQQTAFFPAAGGAAISLFFSVSSVNSCTFTVNGLVGSTVTNPGAAQVTHTVGGTVRGVVGLGATSPSIPVAGATSGEFSITYPSLTVKKVVVGEEVTPGADYQMHVLCLNADGVLRGRVASTGFSANGVFSLKAGGTRVISSADMPELFPSDNCHVSEISSNGAGSTTYTSTKADGTTAQGILLTGTTPAVNPFASFNGLVYEQGVAGKAQIPTFVSAATKADGQTITVTNSFIGDLIVSKVVTGDPKTSIAIYEMNVSCNNNGPKETFLLKDRQSKLFTGITTGTSCLVSETRSDGAEASYNDNSGDNTSDGRVTIKGTASGCLDRNLSSFPDCRANVIVTNSYLSSTTTAAATTAAPSATTAPATAAPIAPAPVPEPEVADEEELTVG